MITPEQAQEMTKEELEIVGRLEEELDKVILRDSKHNIVCHSLETPSDLGNPGHRVYAKIRSMYGEHYDVQIDRNKSPYMIFLGPK